MAVFVKLMRGWKTFNLRRIDGLGSATGFHSFDHLGSLGGSVQDMNLQSYTTVSFLIRSIPLSLSKINVEFNEDYHEKFYQA